MESHLSLHSCEPGDVTVVSKCTDNERQTYGLRP